MAVQMIKIENLETYGLRRALYGMRQPMQSHHKSDTTEDKIGVNDLDLANRLAKAGTEHRKFARQIFVSFDVTAPTYWYLEMDTYKVGTTSNSTSKMHKLLSKPFTVEDFSFDGMSGFKNEVEQVLPNANVEIEEWVLIDKDYEVSSEGRIRRILNGRSKLLGGSLHNDGYIFVTIHGKQKPLHRYIAKAFIPGGGVGKQVNHKNGNKQDNRASNLEWCSSKENIEHSYKHCLQPVPTSTYKGKLSEEQRKEVKKLVASGVLSRRKAAEKYGVSHSCINGIISDQYSYQDAPNVYFEIAKPLVDKLNELRECWINSRSDIRKAILWKSILQLLPMSYNQTRTVTLNYEVVANMVSQRKHHKLSEWLTFCDYMVESLPYFKEIFEDTEVMA